MKRFTKTYPALFGMPVSKPFFGLIIAWAAVEDRYPSVHRYLGNHPGLGLAIIFTVALFVIGPFCAWEWHSRRGFWPSLLLFFALHIAGVLLYNRMVGPLSRGAWRRVIVAESFLFAFFMYAGTHLGSLRKTSRAQHSDLSAQGQNGVGASKETHRQ